MRYIINLINKVFIFSYKSDIFKSNIAITKNILNLEIIMKI